MEKKVRVKRLNHQDDVKRSWAAAYPLTEDFESTLPEDCERESERDSAENDSPQIQPLSRQYNADS
jgi:hypothetical protein